MHTAQSTAEHTCSATHPSIEANAEAFFERVQRCLSQIALLGANLPANDPDGMYAYWYAAPLGIESDRRPASTIAHAAALVAAGAFPCRHVKAIAMPKRGERPDALFLEVDGYTVKIVAASSMDGRKILADKAKRDAQDALAAMAAARLRGEEAA